MTTREANSKVVKLFNQWQREFTNYGEAPTDEYYKRLEAFKKQCRDTHNIGGLYQSISDKNALKMASICASLRFVEPWQMLTSLQHTTKSY